MTGSLLGNAVKRVEDPALLTGAGRYVDDLPIELDPDAPVAAASTAAVDMTAGLSALVDDRLQHGARAVERGGEAGGAGAEDDDLGHGNLQWVGDGKRRPRARQRLPARRGDL